MMIYNAFNYSSQPLAPAIFCYAVETVSDGVWILNDKGSDYNAEHLGLPRNWEWADIGEYR